MVSLCCGSAGAWSENQVSVEFQLRVHHNAHDVDPYLSAREVQPVVGLQHGKALTNGVELARFVAGMWRHAGKPPALVRREPKLRAQRAR